MESTELSVAGQTIPGEQILEDGETMPQRWWTEILEMQVWIAAREVWPQATQPGEESD